MQTYIVIFVTTHKRDALVAKIKQNSGWASIAHNAYAVVTEKTASQLRDELYALKDLADKVFVVRSGAIAAWSNYSDSNSNWFKNHL